MATMMAKAVPLTALLSALGACFLAGTARAETPPLPAPEAVFAVAVKPQARQHPVFFTPERLKAALPRFKPASVTPPIGGKIWTQSGVIVLKDGDVLFWKSYRDDLIAVETATAPRVYVME